MACVPERRNGACASAIAVGSRLRARLIGLMIGRIASGARPCMIAAMTNTDPDITIRVPTEDDIPALISLISQLGYDMPADRLAALLPRFLSGEDYRVHVAEIAGRVTGLAALHIFPWFHRPDAAARLTALVVEEGARGTGVGKALLAHAEGVAAAADCTAIELTSGKRRIPDGTHAFYLGRGYRDAGGETTLFRKTLTPAGG